MKTIDNNKKKGIYNKETKIKNVYKIVDSKNKVYYKALISLKGKRINLGRYKTENMGALACKEAYRLYSAYDITLYNILSMYEDNKGVIIPFYTMISIINYRDNKIFLRNPIYIRYNYISYFIDPIRELKFDIDELFFYSSHRILSRGNLFYVNNFGSQERLLNRYGIHSFSVRDRDYFFINGDYYDYRSTNIEVVNRYFGVFKKNYTDNRYYYEVRIHINGDFIIGRFKDEIMAAISYNKACDYANQMGLLKDFNQNYIDELSITSYKKIYDNIKLPKNYISYFEKR